MWRLNMKSSKKRNREGFLGCGSFEDVDLQFKSLIGLKKRVGLRRGCLGVWPLNLNVYLRGITKEVQLRIS